MKDAIDADGGDEERKWRLYPVGRPPLPSDAAPCEFGGFQIGFKKNPDAG